MHDICNVVRFCSLETYGKYCIMIEVIGCQKFLGQLLV